MLIDTFFDSLVGRLGHSKHQKSDNLSSNPHGMNTRSRKFNNRRNQAGFFRNANHFVIDRSTFVENHGDITQHFAIGNSVFDPVLELIAPYTDPDAAVDSSARFPPPLCHPGTRLQIGGRLADWLTNSKRQWSMMWLHGSAGTGKSAVAQTFAERCAVSGRLGASFFFSRSNGRDDPDTVIPTLAYQLAVCHPEYKSLLTTQLASDPQLLRKARHIQFKRLIVEPFSQLQTQRRKRIREPFLILLDGLDECRGERAQREIIEMISEVVRLKKDLPLLWLICSRPEAHLKYIFSMPDFMVSCGREELVIDAESIADVDLYLRDGLVGIRVEFRDVTTPTWPSEEQVTELSIKASGHFAFAATAVRYIGDPTFATPMTRLEVLLSYLQGIRAGTTNPLEALDVLYSRILGDVPAEALPIVKRILGYFIFLSDDDYLDLVQALCSFLRVSQTTFYSAFRRLHSVVDMPLPETACDNRLRFYHTSFEDYLRDPTRSGEFAIEEPDVNLDYAKCCLSWYEADLTLFHSADGPEFNESHNHGILPSLGWTSDAKTGEVSREIARLAEIHCWWACKEAEEWDDTLLSQIQNFDFRYIRTTTLAGDWYDVVNKLWETGSSSNVIRTVPCNEVDLQLLEYVKHMTIPGWPIEPAVFPLHLHVDTPRREYFILGCGLKAVVCLLTHNSKHHRVDVLNYDEPSSKKRLDRYSEWLEREQWFETDINGARG